MQRANVIRNKQDLTARGAKCNEIGLWRVICPSALDSSKRTRITRSKSSSKVKATHYINSIGFASLILPLWK